MISRCMHTFLSLLQRSNVQSFDDTLAISILHIDFQSIVIPVLWLCYISFERTRMPSNAQRIANKSFQTRHYGSLTLETSQFSVV